MLSEIKLYPYCSDVSSLAKAAVAGDEAAMDMLWRKSAKSSASSSDYSFFFGVEDGKCVCCTMAHTNHLLYCSINPVMDYGMFNRLSTIFSKNSSNRRKV